MKVSKEAGYEGRLADAFRTAKDVLRRRFLTLALITLGITALGIFLTLRITPSYTGVVRLQIDPSRNPLARTASEAQAQLLSEAIETEVAVVDSLDLARTVTRRLNLAHDPEFNEALKTRGGMNDSDQIEVVANNVLSHLSVSREKLTYIIGIRFVSGDAAKSARIANAFATGYLDTKVGSKIGTAERQFRFFQQRMDELAKEARDADEKVAQYSAQAGIVRGGATQQGTTIADAQVGPLALQLATAESDAAAARAKLDATRSQAAAGHLDAAPDVQASNIIASLRAQRASLMQNLDDINARYGDRHPETTKVRDQLAGIDQQIREESTRIYRSLGAYSAAAEARAASLRGGMQRLENEQSANARASVIAASLQRDADSKHAAYDKLAQLAMETRQSAQNGIAQAQIIDPAETPLHPSWPNKPLLFLLSFIVGAGAGIAAITAQELMVSGLRSVEDVEENFDIPLLGAIPVVKKTSRPADLLIERPTSAYSEALRNIRASLLGVRTQSQPKIIAITSALPNEGKTTTALGLARTMAINGGRTILVDADVRRAQMRQIITDARSTVGIVEVLHGEATLDEAIQSSQLERLDYLLVTKPYFSSENLFGDDQMPQLLKALSARYDTIVLDLPPLVGLADGRFLAALADSVALVIRWNTTPTRAVESAVGWLKSDGANLVGAMYSMVDSGAQAAGGMYYYGKQYSPYYQEG